MQSLKASLLGAVLVGLSLLPGTALAIPYHFTFEGVVNWGPADDLGMLGAPGDVDYGDAVTFVFEVDFDRPGEKQTFGTDPVPVPINDSVYVDLVSGSRLDPADVGLTLDVQHDNIFWTGESGAAYAEGNSHISWQRIGTNGHHLIEVRNDLGATLADYVVGATGFSVYERVAINGVGATRYQVLNELTLTDISPVSVPVAPSFLFLLTGAGLILGQRRRG